MPDWDFFYVRRDDDHKKVSHRQDAPVFHISSSVMVKTRAGIYSLPVIHRVYYSLEL